MPPLVDTDVRGGVRPGFVPPPPGVHTGPGYSPFPDTAQTTWAPPATAPVFLNKDPPSSLPWGTRAHRSYAQNELKSSYSYPVPGTLRFVPTGFPTPNANVPKSRYLVTLILYTLLRGILLLNLPALYVSRVDEIFQGVEQGMPEIQDIIKRQADDTRNVPVEGSYKPPYMPQYIPQSIRPWAVGSGAIDRLIQSWEHFVGSLVREWETLNVVSVLLSGAILTTLQIDGAVTDPYTRYFAFLSLVCSLMSVLYGSIYIIRFNTMRRTRKVVEWAEQAQKTIAYIWWNVYILLAMPIIWFSWSFILYLVCVMTLLWRTGTSEDAVLQITPLVALVPRIVITGTVLTGLICLCFVIREFRRYGNAMDQKWKNTLNGLKNPRNDRPDLQQTDPERTHTSWGLQQGDEFLARTRQNLRPDEYDSDIPATRPKDWRPDYGIQKTFIQKLEVPSFKDTIRCAIHKTLSYRPSDTSVMYDLRFLPGPQTLAFSILGRPYDHKDLAQLATNPPVEQMRLFHPLLPWYIDVHKKKKHGVTIEDVIMQLHFALQSQIKPRDYFNEELGSEIRDRIARAYERRTEGTDEAKNGIKKVDYLEEENILVGLVRTKNGLWEMKTRGV